MLKVIDPLNMMKIMGCEIDREIQVDMILETLPETFDNVKLNCSFEWLTYPLTGAMKGLPAAIVLSNMCMNKIKEASLVMNKDSSSKIKESAKTSSS